MPKLLRNETDRIRYREYLRIRRVLRDAAYFDFPSHNLGFPRVLHCQRAIEWILREKLRPVPDFRIKGKGATST